MRVVSFYTPSYRAEAARLISSLRRLGLPSTVLGVADQGDWHANTHLKPIFLRRMLEIAGEPVLWVDADAVVWQEPEFFLRLEQRSEPPDLSCFYGTTPDGREVLLSGTLWLNRTPACLQVLERWIAANAEAPSEWDQVTLQQVLARPDCDAVVEPCASEYCYVFDVHRASYGLEGVPQPIIEHFQASRRLKSADPGAGTRLLCARAQRRLELAPTRGSRPLGVHHDLPRDLPEAFVVGGGASLRDFDWRQLDFRFTIAVNRAWEVLPAANIHFTASERFHSWVATAATWREHPALKVVLDRGHWPYGSGVWTVPASDRQRPADIDRGLPDVGSSGHGAVALALALGARRIFLLGFDADPEAGRWHSGYPWPNAPIDWFLRRRELKELIRTAGPGRVVDATAARHLPEPR